MDIVRQLTSFVLMTIFLAEASLIERSGLIGHSVKLPCSGPHSQPPKVVWNDRVYSSTSEPILIFQSENNQNFLISSSHPNAVNFKIDRNNFELRISNLSTDSAGEYSCISESGGTRTEKHYYLTVHGNLKCKGRTQLQEGQETKLTCQVMYAGSRPTLKWLREDDQEVSSVDKSELTEEGPKGEQELQLKVTHEYDDKTYRCRMDFGDKSEDCPLHFNVTYPVRDVGFTAMGNEVYVGQEVACTARGNPAPEVSLVATSIGSLPDDRVKSHIIIPQSWEGSTVTLECTANNTYKGKLRSAQKSVEFQVLPATTTVTTTTTPKPTVKTTTKAAEPGKPAVNGNENSAAKRPSPWIAFQLLVVSLILGVFLSPRC